MPAPICLEQCKEWPGEKLFPLKVQAQQMCFLHPSKETLPFSYQLYSFIGASFGLFGKSISFINIVLYIAVGLKSYCGVQGKVFCLIKDSIRKQNV